MLFCAGVAPRVLDIWGNVPYWLQLVNTFGQRLLQRESWAVLGPGLASAVEVPATHSGPTVAPLRRVQELAVDAYGGAPPPATFQVALACA